MVFQFQAGMSSSGEIAWSSYFLSFFLSYPSFFFSYSFLFLSLFLLAVVAVAMHNGVYRATHKYRQNIMCLRDAMKEFYFYFRLSCQIRIGTPLRQGLEIPAKRDLNYCRMAGGISVTPEENGTSKTCRDSIFVET